MNAPTRADPFSSAHMCVKRCFCGRPTVEDHDFCFCSPECARADAMRALGGDDCHYRKVVRKAYVNSGAPEPVVYKRKPEDKRRRFQITKHVPGITPLSPPPPPPPKPTHQYNKPIAETQGEENSRKEKVFPTLSQVTSTILARKARHGGDPVKVDTLSTNPTTVKISPFHQHTTQQTKPEFFHDSQSPAIAEMFRAPQQTVPLKIDRKVAPLRDQPSITRPKMGMGMENGAFLTNLDRRTEDRPMSPRPQRQIPAISMHDSGKIRRPALFAGRHRPTERRVPAAEEEESLMQLFNQLSDVRTWIESYDGTPHKHGKPGWV